LGLEFREKLSFAPEDLKEDRREAELVEHRKGVMGIWSRQKQQ
jgi:hypothetical protein